MTGAGGRGRQLASCLAAEINNRPSVHLLRWRNSSSSLKTCPPHFSAREEREGDWVRSAERKEDRKENRDFQLKVRPAAAFADKNRVRRHLGRADCRNLGFVNRNYSGLMPKEEYDSPLLSSDSLRDSNFSSKSKVGESVSPS